MNLLRQILQIIPQMENLQANLFSLASSEGVLILAWPVTAKLRYVEGIYSGTRPASSNKINHPAHNV